jgi:hypothetical protein
LPDVKELSAAEEDGAEKECIAEKKKWWRVGTKCDSGNECAAGKKCDAKFRPILKHPLVLSRKDGPRFIQPGVTQWYRKPLQFPPADIHMIHVWAAFSYHIEAGPLIWFLAGLLIQRPDVRNVNYTVRRTFDLSSGLDTSINVS